MKKLICLALALCVAAFALAGCNKKEEGDPASGASPQPATATPTPTPAPQAAKGLRVTADSGLNVRSQPTTESEILGLTQSGDRLALAMEDPQDGWYQVHYQGQTAYVSADYVEVIEITLEEYNQLRGTGETSSSSSSSTSSASSGESSSSAPESPSSASAPESSYGDSEDGE